MLEARSAASSASRFRRPSRSSGAVISSTRAEVEPALVEMIARTAISGEGESIALAVETREGGPLLGEVTLALRSYEHRQVEIGFAFHPDAGGRGYATEAAREMLRLGFEELGAHRVFGRTDALNERSETKRSSRSSRASGTRLLLAEINDEANPSGRRADWRCTTSGCRGHRLGPRGPSRLDSADDAADRPSPRPRAVAGRSRRRVGDAILGGPGGRRLRAARAAGQPPEPVADLAAVTR